VRRLCLDTPGGRALFRELDLTLDRGDRAAIVGRNGVGKSSLLGALAGGTVPDRGVVARRGSCVLVPQQLALAVERSEGSPGELRRRALGHARDAQPDLLLLDEPTRDLDETGVAWLLGWLAEWHGALLVVSHDPRLLALFDDFFVVAESGCRHLSGTFDEIVATLARESDEVERRYVRNLNRLLDAEKHQDAVRRRRQRKKNLGRLHELRRCPARAKLNGKRSYAQESQGKRALLQERRAAARRDWTRATRRALSVELPLAMALPRLPEPDGPITTLDGVSAEVGGRTLFDSVSFRLARERIALSGPNGSGKTTLIEIAIGRRAPSGGRVHCDASRIGYVAQDGANWLCDESVLEVLQRSSDASTVDDAARLLRAHQFPFALADRPLCSLSPGERLRAALICLCQRRPAPEVWVLDEPTDRLDFLGVRALTAVLSTWNGGLLVASHDPAFLDAIGVGRRVELGR
jgi:ATPase subunit of ABC transporter with duplicated ATPase domains